jgi:hypothetical protein
MPETWSYSRTPSTMIVRSTHHRVDLTCRGIQREQHPSPPDRRRRPRTHDGQPKQLFTTRAVNLTGRFISDTTTIPIRKNKDLPDNSLPVTRVITKWSAP